MIDRIPRTLTALLSAIESFLRIELLRILHLLQTRDGKSSHEQLLVLALERIDVKIKLAPNAHRPRSKKMITITITKRMIRNAAKFLAAEVGEVGLHHIRRTPGGVEWRSYYVDAHQALGVVGDVQHTLDGYGPLRLGAYGLSGDSSDYGFSAEAEKIGEKIVDLADVLVARQNRRNRDAALRRDPHAGADLVYVTQSVGF